MTQLKQNFKKRLSKEKQESSKIFLFVNEEFTSYNVITQRLLTLVNRFTKHINIYEPFVLC